jgi:hypothetical protein
LLARANGCDRLCGWQSVSGWAKTLLTLAIAALGLTTHVDQVQAQQDLKSGQVAPPSLVAGKVVVPPTIDGNVGVDEWAGASVAGDFVQYQPVRGAPATRPTTVLLLHDDSTLFVAFRVTEDGPVVAQLTSRDADLTSDDAAVLILDTFRDRQSAYYFVANALGTQADGLITNDGRTVDTAWDGIWTVAASRTDTGWSVEFEIPLRLLKYVSGEDVAWGVNFARTRRATLEISHWSGPRENPWRVSDAGTVTGLTVKAPASRHQIIPYGLTVASEGQKPEWKAGVDARYEITSTTSIFGTVNPDFALIEADQETVNLTRFELSLPEKRQFFLEGNSQFRQRIRTFYSRRISDIDVGGKVLGREGPWSFAGIYTRANPSGEDGLADYGVARAQRDLGRSNIGLIAAGRRFEGLNQGSLGLDSNLFFSDTWGMTAQFAESFGEFGSGTAAWFVRPSYDSSTGHVHLRVQYIGENFRENVNPVGFIRDDDRRELDSAIEKTWWPSGSVFERIEYGSNYNIYWAATSSLLRRWEIRQSMDFQLRNRFSGEIEFAEEFIVFEDEFRNREVGFEVGYNTREFESATVGYAFGKSFDSDFQLWTAAAAYKFTEQLAAQYELEYLTLDPDPEEESTWIHVVRADQFFTPDLFLRLFFQTNSAIDRNNVQATFVYRYQPPFGTIQVAFQRGTGEFGQEATQGNTLFVKATYVF